MREKYIEEHIRRWFIFGRHPSGHVDVSDGEGDVFQDVPEQFAQEAIAHRSIFVDRMVAYWMARPDEWYRLHSHQLKDCKGGTMPAVGKDVYEWEEPIRVMRPYPHIICNAKSPPECVREPNGYCARCHIPGFHQDRSAYG